MAAAKDVWRALWISRAVVLVSGVGAAVVFGVARPHSALDPPGVVGGFGRLGDLLAAPVARWDAVWYLTIARFGYRPDLGLATAPRTAFFPLYPLGLRGIAELGIPPIAAGVALSTALFAAALYGIHRLCTLELGRLASVAGGHGGDVARTAVLVTAFAPMAFYFSAVYSESLFLALSVGVFWCARNGRWRRAGVLGAAACATRSAGLVLVVPMVLLYLYGPREDRAPDFAARPRPRAAGGGTRVCVSGERTRAAGEECAPGSSSRAWWRPCYALRRDALWVAAPAAGIAAYMAYLALAGGSASMPFHAQDVWHRQFAGPFVGVWDGAVAAFDGARQLLSGQRAHIYFAPAGGSPFVDAGHNLMLFAFLPAAVPMVVGVLRRLPAAYGAYVIAALTLPLSYPVAAEPLMSLPRFEVVLFPLAMWAGAWLAGRPRMRLGALAGSTLLMVFFVGEFATWHWVA
jgi:hypothetical protein